MNVVIADDHPLFRDALIRLIHNLFKKVNIQKAEDFPSLMKLLDKELTWPDCLFIDLNMPGGNAFEHIYSLRNQFDDLPIVVITGSESAEDQRMAMQKGATCFLSKSLESNQLKQSVLSTLNTYLPSEVLTNSIPNTQLTDDCITLKENLTQRQKEVYQLICQGDTNKMIAKKLNLTEGTVKLHVRSILQVLGVKNRTQAVAINKE